MGPLTRLGTKLKLFSSYINALYVKDIISVILTVAIGVGGYVLFSGIM